MSCSELLELPRACPRRNNLYKGGKTNAAYNGLPWDHFFPKILFSKHQTSTEEWYASSGP